MWFHDFCFLKKTCGTTDLTKVAGKISGWSQSSTERDLEIALVNYGPVAIYLYASLSSFSNYKSGIYSDPYCYQQTDHAVLAVGYGVENGRAYWIVKNSWGTTWGM